MSEQRTGFYEVMVMLSTAVASDLAGAVAHINEIFQRGHAEVVAMRKWDERRLAYEIRGQKRAVYILAYIKAPKGQLAHIERDFRLSEKIMRAMILAAEHMTEDQMRAADARKELEVEAKLRAERAVAPESPAPAPAPAPAAEPAAENA
ncbi:MAG: 30S ribosomal protein S6 [Phycisphaeraceae bacterium]|nr:MAG: 30S ribosomal protein S6 [Phycisphaeraceae bacterium]